jgi:hypothetical protein
MYKYCAENIIRNYILVELDTIILKVVMWKILKLKKKNYTIGLYNWLKLNYKFFTLMSKLVLNFL